MRNQQDPPFAVIESVFIPLADGRRLAARIWLPLIALQKDAAQPVPAVLEYLPYRKRDGTSDRDESTYPVFAAAGYAGVRVDCAGHGESDGVFDDEYSVQELADGVEVIDWIASQPWCSGAVGMMGISWGGFNSLQIAALRPKPLQAVIAIGTTVDRYNDDIHYKNGCQLYSNAYWSSTMLGYAARPPDPALVGDKWREMWLERLATQPFPLANWLKHQRRDAFWQHGSICEDYAAIEAATLIISGWCDGYINAPPAAAANLQAPTKAINGPWIHKYPHFAFPRPRMDFHAEALHWWDGWLKGIDNGVEQLPAYRAYICEAIRPQPRRDRDPGRWVAEQHWPSPAIEPRSMFLGEDGQLRDVPGEESSMSICSPQDCGIAAGEFFTLEPEGDLPGDQRIDDGGSLVFRSAELTEPLDILGRPRISLRVEIDAPLGNLAVRLVDVHPDGAGFRVSLGVLNLAHRNGNAEPLFMEPGQPADVDIILDECGYRFKPGHRIQIAISTCYWPLIQPCPYNTTATLSLGQRAKLELPVRPGDDAVEIAEPATQHALPDYPQHAAPETRRWVDRDLNHQQTHYHILLDTGDSEQPGHGLISGERRDDCYSIAADDPLSARLDCRLTCRLRRGDWTVRVDTRTLLTCDAENFYLEAQVLAYQSETSVHERSWRETIPRDFI